MRGKSGGVGPFAPISVNFADTNPGTADDSDDVQPLCQDDVNPADLMWPTSEEPDQSPLPKVPNTNQFN